MRWVHDGTGHDIRVTTNGTDSWTTGVLRRGGLWMAVILLGLHATGCCCFDRLYCPSGGCATGFDPLLDSYEDGGGCSSCGVASCGSGSCATGACRGALRQTTKYNLTCGAGCGEVYWGEWLSNPPDECDPCDNWGGFVGARCCPPRFWDCLCSSFCGMWGGRYAGCGSCGSCGMDMSSGGCSSCGGHDEWAAGGEMMYEGEMVPHGAPSPAAGTPKPAPPETAPPQPAPDSQTRRAAPLRYPNVPAQATQRGRSAGVRPAGGTTPLRKRAT